MIGAISKHAIDDRGSIGLKRRNACSIQRLYKKDQKGFGPMVQIIALLVWCGLLAEIMLRFRTKRITRDPAKTEVLPFKSRILDADRVEKNAPGIERYGKYRFRVYAGFIIFAVVGQFVASAVSSTSQEQLNLATLYSAIGRFIFGSIGGVVGGLIGFSHLKE